MMIKKGDTVYIRSGESKGKTGRVLHVNMSKKSILVEGVNMKKKHQRPTQKSPKGGVLTVEAPVHISNVALYSSAVDGPAKVGRKIINEGGKKKAIRICKKTGEEI